MKRVRVKTIHGIKSALLSKVWLAAVFALVLNSAVAQTVLDSLYSLDSHRLSHTGVVSSAHSVTFGCSDANSTGENANRVAQRVFDDQGLLLEEATFFRGVPANTLYYYDKVSRPVKMVTTHATSGVELLNIKRTHDESGLVSERVTTYDGSLHSLIERITNGEKPEIDSSVERYVAFSLDEQGRMLEQTWFKQGEFERAYLLNYDERDNIERLDVLYPTGFEDSYYYTYDEYGNMLTEEQAFITRIDEPKDKENDAQLWDQPRLRIKRRYQAP